MSAGENRARAGWWAAALFWMGVIFCASLSYLSGARTYGFLARLIQAFHWRMSSLTADRINFAGRKLGHLTEYAILAVLLYAALRRTLPGTARWRPGVAGIALGLAVAYAASDEYHQTFVPGRTPAVHDVMIDAAGAVLGLALVRWRTRKKS